jgi:hypothetical protein
MEPTDVLSTEYGVLSIVMVWGRFRSAGAGTSDQDDIAGECAPRQVRRRRARASGPLHDTQYSVLSTPYSILSTQYSVLST